MKLPDSIRPQLASRWQNGFRRWLADPEPASWPMAFSLGAPTERQALAQRAGLAGWIEAWRRFPGPGSVSWIERSWRHLGVQRLPDKLVLASPEELAASVGQDVRWKTARSRLAYLTARWAPLAAVAPRSFDLLADESDADFDRLVALLAWLVDNPASHLYPRQLPVPGVHSKWLERREGVLRSWIARLHDAPADGDSAAILGLKLPPRPVRVLLLAPELRRQVGGLRDFSAPVDDLAVLPIVAGSGERDDSPLRILIVENLQSALALPDLSGTVAFAALGKGVSALARVPWVQNARIDYWGDIDTHGLHILHLARLHMPSVSAMLMDEATLLDHRDLWTEEPEPFAATDLEGLTEAERALYRNLKQHYWGQSVRLEQERIAWDRVLRSLTGS